jgi:hypothetical protein
LTTPVRTTRLAVAKLITALFALAACLGAIWYLNREAAAPAPRANPPAPVGPRLETPPSAVAPPAATPDGPVETPAERLKNTIVNVSDGESAITADGRRIRYLAIDAPTGNEPFAREATELNRQLVNLKTVQLSPCAKRDVDENGPLFADVSVDGASVEGGLLSLGLAEVRHDPDCIADCRRWWKLTLEAWRDKRGMFRDASGRPTPAVVADRLLGHYGLVAGVVHDIGESSDAFNVNFGDSSVGVFTLTISKSDLEPFLRDKIDPRTLAGKEVTVFGKVVSSYGTRIFGVCPTQVVTVTTP